MPASADLCTCTEDTRDESCPFHSPGSITPPRVPGVAKIKVELDATEFNAACVKMRENMEVIERAILQLQRSIVTSLEEFKRLAEEYESEAKLP